MSKQYYPGFNCGIAEISLRLDYGSLEDAIRFPSLLDADDESGKVAATSLREQKWQGMMNDITDKPDWQKKVRDEKITAKWKKEAIAYGQTVREGFSDLMAKEMIKELQQKAIQLEKTGMVVCFDPGVVKSDVAIPESLKQALKTAVRPLEDVPDSVKDWHPGSNDQVLDLVHPSLWPLIYGKSRMLDLELECEFDAITDMGEGKILEDHSGEDVPWYYSKVFQWLPCDIEFNDKKEVKILSYINNLHPLKHQDLYEVIEKVIDAAIPLWEHTLSSWPVQQRIVLEEIQYSDIPEIPHLEGESESDYEERADELIYDLKTDHIIQPEPHCNPITYETINIKERFFQGLQVIVKLANIHLKPGESYEGGSWHVEGMANERIVSTALYYYDSENITESRLGFRQCADENEFDYDSVWHEDFTYEQNEHQFLEAIYGLGPDESGVQEIGSVECREGRLLTFPNTLQHRVLPFELLDKTKPGHRKILALFLCDPHVTVISTSNVPPQQKHWWVERLFETKGISFMERLPPEIVAHIFSFVNDPMDLEEAKEWRLKLMAERTKYVKDQDQRFNEQQYNLCEH